MENPQLPPHLRPSPTVTKRPPRPLPDDRVVRPLPHPSPASPVSPVTARQGRAHWPSCGPRTSAPRHGTPHKPRQRTRPHCVPARRRHPQRHCSCPPSQYPRHHHLPTVTKRPPRPLPVDRLPGVVRVSRRRRQGRAHWPGCGSHTSAPRHGTPHKPRQLTRPHCVPARRLTHNELQQLPPIAISTPPPFTNRDETPSPSAPRRRPRPRRRPGRPSPPGRAEHTGPAVAHVHLSSVTAHLTNRVSTHVRTVSQLAA